MSTAPILTASIQSQDNVFDALAWLRLKAHLHLEEARLKPVLYFCLLWNLFEDEVFKKQAKGDIILSEIAEKIRINQIDCSKFDEHMRFLKANWFPNGCGDAELNRFFPECKKNETDTRPEKDRKERIQKAFANEATETDVGALFLLVFRVRCHLFHGEKKLHSLCNDEQMKLLDSFNKLITTFLDNHDVDKADSGGDSI